MLLVAMPGAPSSFLSLNATSLQLQQMQMPIHALLPLGIWPHSWARGIVSPVTETSFLGLCLLLVNKNILGWRPSLSGWRPLLLTIKLSRNLKLLSNKCLTTSNKKLVETSATLLVTSALLLGRRSFLVTRSFWGRPLAASRKSVRPLNILCPHLKAKGKASGITQIAQSPMEPL